MSNERLEYLGDSVLNTIVADYLFKKFPLKNEGFLTEMRSRIVSRESLNKLSQKLGLDKLIQIGAENTTHFHSVKGDAFEAIVGAIYLDKGYEQTKKIVIGKIIQLHFDLNGLALANTNYKSRLIEWSQREKKAVNFRVVKGREAKGFHQQYEVEACIEEDVYGTGYGQSIKAAEQDAAMRALLKLEEANYSTEPTDISEQFTDGHA